MLTILFCKLETPKIVVFAKKRDYQESLQVILIQNSSSIQPTPFSKSIDPNIHSKRRK